MFLSVTVTVFEVNQ